MHRTALSESCLYCVARCCASCHVVLWAPSATAVTHNGLTDREWSALNFARVAMAAEVLMGFIALYFAQTRFIFVHLF